MGIVGGSGRQHEMIGNGWAGGKGYGRGVEELVRDGGMDNY